MPPEQRVAALNSRESSVDLSNSDLPVLTTKRLVLRPFTMQDCPAVAALCADGTIAQTIPIIPHPYELRDAEKWISAHPHLWSEGKQSHWAITLRDPDGGIQHAAGHVIGSVGLMIERAHLRAELGYWLGPAYWSRGYTTEAARAVLAWGFEVLGLNRIFAHHMIHNIASGMVMQKLGMRDEGVLRQHVVSGGIARDCPYYGILRSEFERQ
jgi:[ribosomal protein S5]-alanine N-acetyltransferase